MLINFTLRWTWLVLFCTAFTLLQAAEPKTKVILNVRTFGARGDGKTKDTAAFQRALDACSAKGGGVVVAADGNYLIGSLVLQAKTTLQIDKDATLITSPDESDYPIVDVRWEGRRCNGRRALISANKADHIAVIGEGRIIGNAGLGELRDPRGPCLFEPTDCKDVQIEGLSFEYSRMGSIHLTYCEDVLAKNLTMRSDPQKSNGDGIDVDSCRRVLIEHCDFDNGDDAIALKSGRGMEAIRVARPCEDIRITDSILASSFAGVAFGTEMSAGIRNVRIERCTFPRGSHAIFIKSRLGHGGTVENISGVDLDVGTKIFLGINLLNKGIADSEAVEGEAGIPRVRELRFSRIKAHCGTLVDASAIPAEKPLDIFSLIEVTGTCTKGIILSNTEDAELRDIDVTGFSGALITGKNVHGYGFDTAR